MSCQPDGLDHGQFAIFSCPSAPFHPFDPDFWRMAFGNTAVFDLIAPVCGTDTIMAFQIAQAGRVPPFYSITVLHSKFEFMLQGAPPFGCHPIADDKNPAAEKQENQTGSQQAFGNLTQCFSPFILSHCRQPAQQRQHHRQHNRTSRRAEQQNNHRFQPG